MTMAVDKNDFKYILMKDAEWCNHLGFSDFEGLNNIIDRGKAVQLVNLCEARHENRCNTISYYIKERGNVKVILLAGPSSSGKTSTSLRIALQCKVHGLNPRTIELDNYFLDREQTPKLPDGGYDYECLEAMDLKLLNHDLCALLSGEEVDIPTFDFKNGAKVWDGKHKMHLEANDILILEGIHALDPEMTHDIPEEAKFYIYVSDISSISNYDPNIHTTDNRLLRRMVRDNRVRGISPEETILRWPSVRQGEEKWIFPFQKNANMVFNSTVQYELPLLKHFATPLLRGIGESSPAYAEAQRLLGVLKNIEPLPLEAIQAIPCTSIMREFIGGQILSRELL